jgi:hypothetical protein
VSSSDICGFQIGKMNTKSITIHQWRIMTKTGHEWVKALGSGLQYRNLGKGFQ